MAELTVDVCIIGGGLVGGVMAVALAEKGITSVVIDQESPEAMLIPSMDGRTTAVNLACKEFFDSLGLWGTIAPEAESILDIKVYEGNSPWSIHFDHQELGADPMGFIVENRFIRQSIIDRALSLTDKIHWKAPDRVLAKKITRQGVEIHLESGAEISAQLLIGAEGRHSSSRDEVGITKKEFTYKQKALVFSVTHEKHHEQYAWEVFYPSGPLAFLPVKDDAEGRHRSGVVWTLPLAEADHWMAQSDADVAAKLHELFPHLGQLSLCTQKWCYPLSAQMVSRFIDERYVIIGDAAHVCHPVAGQGVNVGWRDAEALANVLAEHQSLGSDLGAQSVLKQYQRARRVDTYSMFAITDVMVRLFSNNSTILGFLRSAGLGAVNRVTPLKHFFMKRAMGR